MKIRKHHYTLQPSGNRFRTVHAPREGILLEVTFEDGAVGYADLHPWTEFGHASLARQLASLRVFAPTPLAALALRYARMDAEARRARISLFDGLAPLRSHALFTDWIHAPRSMVESCLDEGYTAIKLKIGCHPEREAEVLNGWSDIPVQWRLDANATFASGEDISQKFFIKLSTHVCSSIEFVEDPCAYNAHAWKELFQRTQIPLALDWQLPWTPPPWEGARIVILKPASQNASILASAAKSGGMELVVTHSMDHPLGQAVALWTAMQLHRKYGALIREGGLQALGLYESDDFGRCLRTQGAMVIPPEGTGFGFDELLAALPWVPLE